MTRIKVQFAEQERGHYPWRRKGFNRIHSADRQQVAFRKRKGNSERRILRKARKYTKIHDE